MHTSTISYKAKTKLVWVRHNYSKQLTLQLPLQCHSVTFAQEETITLCNFTTSTEYRSDLSENSA